VIVEETVDRLRILTIARPERRNALSRTMAQDLIGAVGRFGDDKSVDVVLLTGRGGEAFCAGADLKEMAADQAAGKAFEPILPDLYRALLATPKPTVAAVNGDAVGGGFELALACDVRVANDAARFGLPEARSGMVPRFGVLALAALGARALAAELGMSGTLVPASRLANAGLLSRVVRADAVRSTALELARSLAAAPPGAVAAVKDLLVRAPLAPLVDLPHQLPEVGSYGSAEWAAGVAAFGEARPASHR